MNYILVNSDSKYLCLEQISDNEFDIMFSDDIKKALQYEKRLAEDIADGFDCKAIPIDTLPYFNR